MCGEAGTHGGQGQRSDIWATLTCPDPAEVARLSLCVAHMCFPWVRQQAGKEVSERSWAAVKLRPRGARKNTRRMKALMRRNPSTVWRFMCAKGLRLVHWPSARGMHGIGAAADRIGLGSKGGASGKTECGRPAFLARTMQGDAITRFGLRGAGGMTAQRRKECPAGRQGAKMSCGRAGQDSLREHGALLERSRYVRGG